ncbi:hypothetical protein BH11ACT4_BH11ACT4_14780 [soil metagenome]
MDGKRKRPWWLGWIPATVLLILIVGTVVTTSVLLSGGLGKPAPAATDGQVTDLNWSIFTAKGLAYIDSTRQVRIDFSRGPADAAALGLPADGSITIGPKDNGDVPLDYYLIVNGGGAGQGGDKFAVSQLTIETTAGVVSKVTAPLSDVLGFRQTLTKLEKKAPLFGWDVSGEAAIYARVEQASHDDVPYEFTFGPGDAVGVPISATAKCGTDGGCVVEYDVLPAVR